MPTNAGRALALCAARVSPPVLKLSSRRAGASSMGCCCSTEGTSKAQKGADGERPSRHSRTSAKKKAKSDTKYVALWDYKAASKAELDLTKGEILEEEIEERDAGPEWVFVSRVGKGGTGYAPRAWLAALGTLEAEKWYFGIFARHDAEKLLGGLPDGMFVVRAKPAPKQGGLEYVVSVSYNNGVRHYRLKNTTSSEASDRGKKPVKPGYFLGQKKFDTIQEMVLWFQKSSDGIVCLLAGSPGKPIPERITLPAEVQKNWQEIPRSQITIEKDIGKGNFGIVRKGVWKPTPTIALEVAVKELKPGSAGARKQFLQEAVAMKNLVHERLVKLHGIVSAEEPFWIITEFVKDGSLRTYLRKRAKEQRWLEEAQLVNIATQIADGMRYLESKGVIHRDLAARNVLVEEKPGATDRDTKVDVKIADFGMAKMGQKGHAVRERAAMELAVKWTAPEALADLRFYTSSDVWSFGILVYEIFTHGGEPYKGMSPREVKDYVVKQRKIIDPAENMPENVYELIKYCCMYDHNGRLSFQEIFEILEKFYEKGADPYERYRQ